MVKQTLFDTALVKKHDRSGPRYTSYPASPFFTEPYDVKEVHQALAGTRGRPISLYVHLPFCSALCWYCGCHKSITRDRQRIDRYLDDLEQEILLVTRALPERTKVEQLHWGGGSPSYLDNEQMSRCFGLIQSHFDLDLEGEISIEGDPRQLTPERIHFLRRLGFNRLSLGLQDFDPRVQETINRIQPEEDTLPLIPAAREAGFKSVSVDLIYGLPHQSRESFDATLDKVLSVQPDRLSVFNYAHIPSIIKSQRMFQVEDLPGAEEKLSIFQGVTERLLNEGYRHIGMDHFARTDDELCRALDDGLLQRNFQGYSTHGELDLLALGVSAISHIQGRYWQNTKALKEYRDLVQAGILPIAKGLTSTSDDLIRHEVIMTIMCGMGLDYARVEQHHGIDFTSYFAEELPQLDDFFADGLLEHREGGFQVTPSGRFLVRNIARVFDQRLNQSGRNTFSKVI